jgi:hypothetical protein
LGVQVLLGAPLILTGKSFAHSDLPALSFSRVHTFSGLRLTLRVAARKQNSVWERTDRRRGKMIFFGIAKQWQRHAIFFLGRFARMVGPGLYFYIPLIERVLFKIDKRIIAWTIPSQRSLTKDNIPVDVDAIIFYQVLDENAAILNRERSARGSGWRKPRCLPPRPFAMPPACTRDNPLLSLFGL